MSSFKIGKDQRKFQILFPKNKKTAYISNALDFADGDEWVKKFTDEDMAELKKVGLNPERFDLRKYFDKQDQLSKELKKYGVIWVSGGNVFVLRQAMALSGFDTWLQKNRKVSGVLYGGYSAGACALCPSLYGLDSVDSTTHKPYGDQTETIWKGIGIVDYLIVPHFNSDHPESKSIREVVRFCESNNITYKTLKDGEALVV